MTNRFGANASAESIEAHWQHVFQNSCLKDTLAVTSEEMGGSSSTSDMDESVSTEGTPAMNETGSTESTPAVEEEEESTDSAATAEEDGPIETTPVVEEEEPSGSNPSFTGGLAAMLAIPLLIAVMF